MDLPSRSEIVIIGGGVTATRHGAPLRDPGGGRPIGPATAAGLLVPNLRLVLPGGQACTSRRRARAARRGAASGTWP